jgi:DNA-binding transcriptional ArsR family regulator
MSTEPNVAAVAMLIGDPTREVMLTALLSGQALPAGELAARARVSPQTASAHLARLIDGGLLVVAASGRHRYYRLSSPQVAHALEALAVIAPPPRVRSLRESEETKAMRLARTCYDHLAGALGVALSQSLLDRGLLIQGDQTYTITEQGAIWLDSWGIDVQQLRQRRRVFAKPCLDWSERRYHIGGALGALITARMFERGWIVRAARGRAVRLTEQGRSELRQQLDLDLDAPAYRRGSNLNSADALAANTD